MIKIDNEKVGDEVTNIILEQVDNRYWQKKKKNTVTCKQHGSKH